jgi:TRAP-type C4-dicarboxylate transport system permease small subunit
LSDAARRLIASLCACALFGYAAVNCLVLYRRMRRQIAEYKDRPLEQIVHSPQYGLTMWLTGVIGVIGFAVASWQLVLSVLALLRGN